MDADAYMAAVDYHQPVADGKQPEQNHCYPVDQDALFYIGLISGGAERPKAERPPMKTLVSLNPKREPKGAQAVGSSHVLAYCQSWSCHSKNKHA